MYLLCGGLTMSNARFARHAKPYILFHSAPIYIHLRLNLISNSNAYFVNVEVCRRWSISYWWSKCESNVPKYFMFFEVHALRTIAVRLKMESVPDGWAESVGARGKMGRRADPLEQCLFHALVAGNPG